jgi:hypothetical protein
MAYGMINRLKQQNRVDILELLSKGVSVNERKKNQLHKVFEESFDAKSIESSKFLEQKLNYMHLNPVRGRHRLVEDWREYEHGSASFYELNQTGNFIPVHYMELQ